MLIVIRPMFILSGIYPIVVALIMEGDGNQSDTVNHTEGISNMWVSNVAGG